MLIYQIVLYTLLTESGVGIFVQKPTWRMGIKSYFT